MGSRIDYTGKNIDYLTVIRCVGYSKRSKHNEAIWLCRCDCGKEIIRRQSSLCRKSVNPKSCGCKRKYKKYRHGMIGTRIYKRWIDMKHRCYGVNDPDYKDYGGRGIVVCDEWLHNFNAFHEWAIRNGYSDDLSLDRIDVNGNY